MSISPARLTILIEQELQSFSDARVPNLIRSLLISPKAEPRIWEWIKSEPEYLCWTVMEDPQSDTAIVYSEFGFGPQNPWGLVCMKNHDMGRRFGMDSGWQRTFLDAFFESAIPTRLPIWRVFKRAASEPSCTKGQAITEEGDWDTTWEMVLKLREQDKSSDYDCDQSAFTSYWHKHAEDKAKQ